MGWGDWLKLGSDVEKEYQKQKKLGEFKEVKSSDPSAVGPGVAKKRGIRDKYGGYANLALKANKLATEGGDSASTPGYRTGRKIPERVKSTVKISDLKKISLDEEDDNKFYA